METASHISPQSPVSSQLLASAPSLALVILLVADPARSVSFYQGLFGVAPAEQSPTFAMFALPGGSSLGLWSSATVQPAPTGRPGASEICIVDPDVDGVHATWVRMGVSIVQPPTNLDFGRTFVALDPDGHRVRVFFPSPDDTASV